MSIEWKRIREITMDVATYVGRKAAAGNDSMFDRAIAQQKIFDELTRDGAIGLIPIEGTDEFAVIFKRRPDDFEAVVGGCCDG